MSPERDPESDMRAALVRQDAMDRANPLPDAMRQELFGDPEVGPSLVVGSAEHAPVFRGLNGSEDATVIKERIEAAAQAMRDDPAGTAKRYAELVERLRRERSQ